MNARIQINYHKMSIKKSKKKARKPFGIYFTCYFLIINNDQQIRPKMNSKCLSILVLIALRNVHSCTIEPQNSIVSTNWTLDDNMPFYSDTSSSKNNEQDAAESFKNLLGEIFNLPLDLVQNFYNKYWLSTTLETQNDSTGAFFQEAENHLKNNQFNLALEFYNKSLDLALNSNQTSVSLVLSKLTQTYLKLNSSQKEGIEHFDSILNRIKNDTANIQLKLEVLYSQAVLCEQQKDYHASLRRHFERLSILKQNAGSIMIKNYTIQLSDTYYCIGYVYHLIGHAKEALENFKSSYELVDVVGDKDKLGMVLRAMSDCYLRLNEHDKAIEYLNEALSIYQHPSDNVDHGLAAKTLRALGMAYRFEKDYESALTYFKQAYDLNEKNLDQNTKQIFHSLNDYADCLYLLHRFQEALDLFEKSLDLQQQSDETYFKTLHIIALCHRKLAAYSKSIDYFKRMVNFLEDNQNTTDSMIKRRGKLMVLSVELGNLHNLMHDFQSASVFYEHGLNLYKQLHDKQSSREREDILELMKSLSKVYAFLGIILKKCIVKSWF